MLVASPGLRRMAHMRLLEIIGLQGAIADGSENTFDGQPMQRGTHLRWGFAPELGFPAGGFWLCRRKSEGHRDIAAREGHLLPPEGWQQLCRRRLERQHNERQGRDDEGKKLRPPRWEDFNSGGWEYLSAPFVLPITVKQWPSRYPGAPNPATTSSKVVVERDIKECRRRLNGLLLDAEMTVAEMDEHFHELRDTLYYLVRDHPGPPSQYDHPLPQSDDGKNAPQLGINIMQKLLLLALNPYFARVLGLYYVDEEATREVSYDYLVLGCWGSLPSATRVIAPGVASGSALAKGEARFGGLNIKVPGSAPAPHARLWRRLRDDAKGNYAPQVDRTAPGDVKQSLEQCVAGVAAKDQPPALLAIDPQDPYKLTFADVCRFTLARAVSAVGVQVAGKGVVDVFSDGALMDSKSFASSALVTLYFESPWPEDSPIDEILIRSEPETDFSFPPKFTKSIIRIGQIALYLLGFNYIGSRWALLQAPSPMKPLQAPDQPVARFRQREAAVIPDGPRLEPRSFFEVLWAARDRTIFPGHGPRDGLVPPPTQPIGFRAARKDTGENGDPLFLRGIIAVVSQPTPAKEPRVPKSPRMHRVTDADVPDPKGDYVYHVAAFDAFGALGYWSDDSDPINVEQIAAAPTLLRVINFDNTAVNGGAATPTGDAWEGGTLTLDLGWSASAAISFPDAVTTRLYVRGADEPWQAFTALVTHDLHTPKFVPKKIMVDIGPKIISPSGAAHVFIRTQPKLPAQTENQPAGVLVLVGVLAGDERVTERYIARPMREASEGNAVVIKVPVSDVSRIIANPSLKIEVAYFIPGAMQRIDLAVPLSVRIDRTLARGEVQARSSRNDPFDEYEMVINPNDASKTRPEPDSVKGTFIGPQRLVPPAPPTPVPSTKHEYYDPADFYGRATRVLPFDTTLAPGVSGFTLFRAPSQALFLADMQRRESSGNVADNANLLALVPDETFDLGSWLGSIGEWLSAFNKRSAKNLSAAKALADEQARRSFAEHFYGGLMDSELRALANINANRSGFARVEAPSIPVSDTIDGKGFERVLYKLGATNAAGSNSQITGAAGPYYTRIVTPPRTAALAKIAATNTSLTIEWTISDNPDIAAYLLYRTEKREDLADLRFFGPDPARPLAPSALAQLVYSHTQRPAMKFSGAPIDPRIRALVADPRIFARDFDGSDRAEIPLPDDTEKIFAVYRLSEFNSAGDPLNQPGAFNYWRPVAKGSRLAAAPRRAKGLRVGLGRGVPVAVVAQIDGATESLGTLTSRRISFVDETGNADAIAGTAAPQPAKTYYYAVVAVDIFGNRSTPSTIFSGQLS
jgi:hypothetical protein